MMTLSQFYKEISHLLQRIEKFLPFRHQKWVLWKTKKKKKNDLNRLNVKYKISPDLNCAKSHELNIRSRILKLCARWRENSIMLLPFYFPTLVSLDRMLSGSESDVKEKSLPLSLSLLLPHISGATVQLRA
jgi:hypothetical protein